MSLLLIADYATISACARWTAAVCISTIQEAEWRSKAGSKIPNIRGPCGAIRVRQRLRSGWPVECLSLAPDRRYVIFDLSLRSVRHPTFNSQPSNPLLRVAAVALRIRHIQCYAFTFISTAAARRRILCRLGTPPIYHPSLG